MEAKAATLEAKAAISDMKASILEFFREMLQPSEPEVLEVRQMEEHEMRKLEVLKLRQMEALKVLEPEMHEPEDHEFVPDKRREGFMRTLQSMAQHGLRRIFDPGKSPSEL